MQDNARKITYGAMMIAMFAILLAVSFYIPLIGSITLFFIPLPIILYRLRYDRMASVLVSLTGITFSMLLGGLALVPFALVFGPLGFVIGDTMKIGKSKLYTFMASGLTLLIIIVMTYVATVLFFGINVIDEVLNGLRESQEIMTSFLLKFGELPEEFGKQMDDVITFYETAIPSIFIIASFSVALLIVIVNATIAKRLGHNTPQFPPFKEMKLPVVLVWCFLVVLLLPLFLKIEQGTTLYLTYVNASVILRFLFLIQGISFIHFYMHEMKLPKWLTVISTIIAFLLNQITVLLGVIDSGMNIRAWIGRNKSS